MFKELEKLDVKEVPRWVGTYVRTTLKELLDGSAYRGRRGRRGTRGDAGVVGTDGPPGEIGASGKRGPTGTPGPHGTPGDDGIQGKRGIQGVAGLTGRAGEFGRAGAKGDKGDQGDQGQVGPVPRHKWEGTRLSFEQPGGAFGQSINLQGPGGGRGASGGRSANPGFSSIALVGTDLVFTRDKAGPLGPDITVDLSGLTGGFAGLGIWRYLTSTGTSPASGRLNFNNVDPELATELYINETNNGGEDLQNFLALLEAGDVIYIQDKGNANNFILVEVATNTDNGSDITIGIANVNAQGAAITNNSQVNLVMSVAGGGGGVVNPWVEFVGQSANPGTIPADTLYQDDGSNYDVGTLVWDGNPAAFAANHSIGPVGFEQGGIDVGGVNFDAISKINDIGGAQDAMQILHRHSTAFAANLAFARTNSDTAAHVALTPGQVISTTAHLGYSGAHYDLAAFVNVTVPPASTVGPTSLAAEFQYYTSPDGSDTPLLALIIGSDQVIYGSNAAAAALTLRGSQDADLGTIVMQSPVEFESISASGAPYAFNYDATESYTAAFVGGGLNMSGDITFSHSTMIYESFRGAPTINTAVAPGFAAYTVLQALPLLNAGAIAGQNPLAPLIINAGPTMQNTFSGTRAVATAAGLSFSPQLKATLSGAVMNCTSMTGLSCSVKYSTVAGSSISFGTIRGLHMQNPGAGLFQPGAGTEIMTALYGVDVQAIPFGGNVAKAAVRSAIVAASNARFLWNIGTAASDFGAGTIHFNDNVAAHFGNTVAAPDAGIYFDGTDFVLDTQITAPNAGHVKIPFGIIVEGDSFPVSDFIRRASSTNLLLSSWRLSGLTSGNMADGFGTALFWSIEDDTSGRVNIAYQSCERAGADNTGLYSLRVYDAGVARQIYTASLDGFAHVATNLGFYSTAPIAQPTAVPVTTIAIHAALVSLGLIT